MALITCEGLTLSYDGSIAAQDISFSVEPGDYLCIVGENGSGKSTLIKGLLGLLSPAAGSIRFGDGFRQTEIGYLPQQTATQKDFPASVHEVVLSGCLNSLGARFFYGRAERKKARESMDLLGISDLSRRCFRELSGGQRQRVLLARALCATKKLLLLDEPATGLDPVVTAELYELVAMLNRERDVAILMVSHDIDAALRYSKHILHLSGTPLYYGDTAGYTQSEVGRRFMGGGANA